MSSQISSYDLLSKDEKRQFFSQLDTFIKQSNIQIRPSESERMNRNEQKRKYNLPQTTNRHTSAKKTKVSIAKDTTSRQNTTKSSDGLLSSKRILIAPIGPDFGKKRTEVLSNIVFKLQGEIVKPIAPKQIATTIASLHAPQLVKQMSKVNINWNEVDIVIVSESLQKEKFCEYYGLPNLEEVPENIEFYTPEYLTYITHEGKLPMDKAFEWEQKKNTQVSSQHTEKDSQGMIVSSSLINASQDSRISNNEGSEPLRDSTRAIQRVPSVNRNPDAVQQEVEEDLELQRQKKALVAERTRIFHINNPGFIPLSQVYSDHGKKDIKMAAFSCQKSSYLQRNFNGHLTDPLEEMMEYFHAERDTWREFTYKKLVTTLKSLPVRIGSTKDIKGKSYWWAKGRLGEKVREILETGQLGKLEAKKSNSRLRALVEISRIWGVGPSTAAKLYSAGFTSIEALRKNGVDHLSDQQKIGLKHYNDFLTKIPRAEVAKIEATVVQEVKKMLPNAIAMACGSYRRGKLSSGDCDVLITDPTMEECKILPDLLQRLHDMNFLTDDLTSTTEHHIGGCDSYMGVCRLNETVPYRRIDIKVYPYKCFGFALLYFTGSDHFNRSMRLYAQKKGWSLSDRALRKETRVNGKRVDSGTSTQVICESEVDVFIALGLEYKDPKERNCFDIQFLDEDEASAKKTKSF